MPRAKVVQPAAKTRNGPKNAGLKESVKAGGGGDGAEEADGGSGSESGDSKYDTPAEEPLRPSQAMDHVLQEMARAVSTPLSKSIVHTIQSNFAITNLPP